MVNPYVILVGLLMLVGSFGLGGYLGYDLARGHEAQRVRVDQDAVIAGARENVFRDTQFVKNSARRQQVAAERARAARSGGIADANLKADAACGWDAVSVGLLSAAIDSANNTPRPAAGVPDPLPDHSASDERGGSGDTELDVRDD